MSSRILVDRENQALQRAGTEAVSLRSARRQHLTQSNLKNGWTMRKSIKCFVDRHIIEM